MIHNRSASSGHSNSFKTIRHRRRQKSARISNLNLDFHRLVARKVSLNDLRRPILLEHCSNIIHSSETQSSNDNLKAKRIRLAGIRNLGNTCYMNSVLQCLSHIQRFTSSVEKPPGIGLDINSTSNGTGNHKRKFMQLSTVNDNSKPEL
jgi:ubiquitin C-terminal hydrolase